MRFKFRGQPIETRVWRPDTGLIGSIVAIDTETERVEDGVVPRLVLTQAYSGQGVVYFIQNDLVTAFLKAHTDAQFVIHNAPFDLAVLGKVAGEITSSDSSGTLTARPSSDKVEDKVQNFHLAEDNDLAAGYTDTVRGEGKVANCDFLSNQGVRARSLVVTSHASPFVFERAVREGRVWDTGLLYRLHKLATEGQVPRRWGLDAVAKEVLDVELNKDGKLRLNFGRYIQPDGTIDYGEITDAELLYAATDAVACFELFAVLMPKVEAIDSTFHLSHKVQLLGAIGLHAVMQNGIGFDVAAREQFLAGIDQELTTHRATLADHGYIPGSKGVASVCEYQLGRIESQLGIMLPRTKTTGRLSSRRKDLAPFEHQAPFIAALLGFKHLEKLKSFVASLEGPRIHAKFNALVNTGRTSCYSPNLQNLPRLPGIRECFVPAEGHCFLIIDYSQLELCTLAQVCIDRFGKSKMADLLNDGIDLHRWFASVMLNKSVDDVTKDERQIAKAFNFGLPGGLGVKAFLDFARTTYAVKNLTEEAAAAHRERWLDAFPEMRRYLADDSLKRLMQAYDFDDGRSYLADPDIGAKTFLRVIGGHLESTYGRPYSDTMIEWALNEVLPKVAPELAGVEKGSPELRKRLMKNIAVQTRTGRIRARCSYTESKNAPFQGLAADGAKVALYRLNAAGYRVVNFIHDEFIIETPRNHDLEQTGTNVEAIVVGAMRAVVPNVVIRTEWFFADRWYKGGKLVRDENGHVVPYSRPLGSHDSKGSVIESKGPFESQDEQASHFSKAV